jgi:hypothetical protein
MIIALAVLPTAPANAQQTTQSQSRYFSVEVRNDPSLDGVRAQIFELKDFNDSDLKSAKWGTLGRAVNVRGFLGERLKDGDSQAAMRYVLAACSGSSGNGRPIADDGSNIFVIVKDGVWSEGVYHTIVLRATKKDKVDDGRNDEIRDNIERKHARPVA